MRHAVTLVFVPAALALAGLLGARALDHVREPGFEPGHSYSRPPALEFEGLQTVHVHAHGELLVRAERAVPGRRVVADVTVGPPTHLELCEVEIELRRDDRIRWSLVAERARLTDDGVEFIDSCLLLRADRPPLELGAARLDLRSGRLHPDG